MTTATIAYVPADTTASVADLLLGIHDGDPASWDEILRRYGNLVSATVRAFRLQEADAVDATQMTWLRLAENAHRVQFPERLAEDTTGDEVVSETNELIVEKGRRLRRRAPVPGFFDETLFDCGSAMFERAAQDARGCARELLAGL